MRERAQEAEIGGAAPETPMRVRRLVGPPPVESMAGRRTVGPKHLVEGTGNPDFEKWLKRNLSEVLEQNKHFKKRMDEVRGLCQDLRNHMRNGYR
jgi:hypothetical protein